LVKEDAAMKQFGTVNSFNEASGHGFIRPDNGGNDLGFETSDLSFIGFNSPKVGQRMSYHVSGKHGRASAVDVRQTLSIAAAIDRRSFNVFRSAAEEAATDVGQVCGRDVPPPRTLRESPVSNPAFHLPDEPSELSLRLLVCRLRDDSARRGVSPRNYAHRLRVIRQQTELLARQSAGDGDKGSK